MPKSNRSQLFLNMLVVMLIGSFVGVGFILWQMGTGLLHIQQEDRRQRNLLTLTANLTFYDEALTSAARMSALTGDASWKQKFLENQKNLVNELETLQTLVPEVMADQAQNVDSANDCLLDIAGASFLLTENHYNDEALDILISPEYLSYKDKLHSEMEQLKASIQRDLDRDEGKARRDMWFHISLVLVLMALILVVWIASLRLLFMWRAKILSESAQRLDAEVKLREQSRFLDNILANLPVGLFTKDVKNGYRWTMWNKKSEALFELAAEEVLGKTDYDNFPAHEADFFRKMDEKTMKEGKVVDIEEEEVTTARGTWLAHTIKVPIYDEDGNPTTLLGIIEDITVRKQQADAKLQAYAAELEQKNDELEEARTRAEAADKSKSEFLATMSHEIRTPLNGVIGSTDLLSRTQLSPQQDDYVRTIRSSGETLLYVINDILDLTKLEAHQLGLEKLAFDFSRTIEDVVDIHSAAAAKKGLDLLLRYAPGTPERIVADPGRLRQILNNLINNAIKFTETGHILVDVESIPSFHVDGRATLRVSVKDTGVGIAPQHHSKIFDRFIQAEASTTRKFGGSGLGLSICKQLVELMGGEMGLESQLGQGSTFWFTLPTEIDQRPVETLAIEDLDGKRVLLVDDNATNIRIMEEMLRYWHCTPTSFLSGNEAMEWLEAYKGSEPPFHMAIIDHDMPEMAGADLGENLRLHPLTGGIPMLIFSSRGMRGDTAYFEEKGFNGYLVKPSRPEEIRQMLGAIFHHKLGERILTRHYIDERAPTAPHKEAILKVSMRVLVVEDDPVNQKVVRLMLEELGCDVHVAASGSTGVQAFEKGQFDLVFMDMQMPEMDGPEASVLMRTFEREHNRERTPIVALTANALAEHRDRCLQAGMDDYMTKPIDHNKLVEVLSRYNSSVPDALPMAKAPSLSQEQLAELQKTFAESANQSLENLEQAALFEDMELWHRAAHRLKGACATFGYAELQELCQQAELCGPEKVEELLGLIKDGLQKIA